MSGYLPRIVGCRGSLRLVCFVVMWSCRGISSYCGVRVFWAVCGKKFFCGFALHILLESRDFDSPLSPEKAEFAFR